MKKLALLVQDLDSDYFTLMVEGARRYCVEKGHQLMVFIIRSKNWRHGSFDYQFYAATSLISKSNIDGILLATNTYCQNAPEEKRIELVRELTFVPLVSIGAEIPGLSSVVSENKTAFKQLLSHITDGHGRKKIVLMMPLSTSVDIITRKDAFIEFHNERNIPFDNTQIIYADYTFEEAKDVLLQICPRKEDIYFDAIVTCSDDLAFGCISALHELNVSVPNEVSVTGFDNQRRCDYAAPTLTSIDQQIEVQGYEAAKLLLGQIENPENGPKRISIPSIPIYRNSCGCKEYSFKRNIFRDEEQLLRRKETLAHFHFFLQEMQASLSLTEFKSLLIKNLKDYGINSCVVCLYDDPVYFGINDEFSLPDSAKVLIAFNKNGTLEQLESTVLNPQKNIIPAEFEFEANKTIVVSSLFNTSYQYGYVAYNPGSVEPRMYELLFSATGIALASNRLISLKDEETKQLENVNQNLKAASMTDSLTGVLNRRGFMTVAEASISKSLEEGKGGAVIYGDMDHLKKINDELGHDIGDVAIQAEVEMFKKVFRESDVIGRMGGDEFAIVVPGISESGFETIKKRLNTVTEEYNKTQNKPFILSISLGVTYYSEENHDINVLLKLADERQYEEKRIHHKERK